MRGAGRGCLEISRGRLERIGSISRRSVATLRQSPGFQTETAYGCSPDLMVWERAARPKTFQMSHSRWRNSARRRLDNLALPGATVVEVPEQFGSDGLTAFRPQARCDGADGLGGDRDIWPGAIGPAPKAVRRLGVDRLFKAPDVDERCLALAFQRVKSRLSPRSGLGDRRNPSGTASPRDEERRPRRARPTPGPGVLPDRPRQWRATTRRSTVSHRPDRLA